jgi:hypothetical protein
MQRSLGHHVSCRTLAILQWLALGPVACGQSESPGSPSSADAPPDAGARPVLFIAPPGVAAVSTDTDAHAFDARTADAPVEASAPRCVPEAGTDEPDEEFLDTDCDGIDGDARRAVFVAPAGVDSGRGTQEDPVRTLAKAMALAASADKSVYVCNGEYAENVRVEHGVRIYGGYDCDNGWRRIPDRARIAPVSGVPLVVVDVVDLVLVDRLSFRAPNADPAVRGSSSIAASVVRSKSVVFLRSVFHAGNGAPGAEGAPGDPSPAKQADGAPGASPAAPMNCVGTLNGQPLQGSPTACFVVYEGGHGARRLCSDGFVQGGDGGEGGNAALGAEPRPGSRGSPSSIIGLDVTGAAGTPGAASLFGFGSIESGAYVADNGGLPGAAGKRGLAGAGGIGGDSGSSGDLAITFSVGGGGGEGGYPGCGGVGGKPGSGGGASLALVSDDSGVRLEASLLESGRGGDGGAGGEGAPGQIGGEGGPGGAGSYPPASTGKPGRRGGDGGRGGVGGPGGGGPSVGIAWTKIRPSVEAVTFVLGTPGLGGVTSARIGADGVVAEIHPPVPSGDAGEGGTP